jgi:hypothetical protein
LFGKMKATWDLSSMNDLVVWTFPSWNLAKESLFILPWRLEEGGAPRLEQGWGVLIEDYILEDLRKVVFGGMHVWGLGLGFRDSWALNEDSRGWWPIKMSGQDKGSKSCSETFLWGELCPISGTDWGVKTFSCALCSSRCRVRGRKRLAVKYEKFTFSYKQYGLIGNDHEQSGNLVWEEKGLQYVNWMLAVRRANQPTTKPGWFIR